VVKLPGPPDPSELYYADEDIRIVDPVPLWRIHKTGGDFPTAWNELRWWGPGRSMRFDAHVPPPSVQDRGVCYSALEVPTAIAEVYQQTRVINRFREGHWLTAWVPARPLYLLDLTGYWPIKAGASYTINTGRKDHCRKWAEAIYTAWPDIDGLLSHSSMTGADMATLFTHAADNFPAYPSFSEPLSHPGLRDDLLFVADQIGYHLV
jgi:hypothetical protein